MLCGKCGKELPNEAAFCSRCGQALSEVPPYPENGPFLLTVVRPEKNYGEHHPGVIKMKVDGREDIQRIKPGEAIHLPLEKGLHKIVFSYPMSFHKKTMQIQISHQKTLVVKCSQVLGTLEVDEAE